MIVGGVARDASFATRAGRNCGGCPPEDQRAFHFFAVLQRWTESLLCESDSPRKREGHSRSLS